MYSAVHRFICIILLTLMTVTFAAQSSANDDALDIQFYGSFLHSDRVPNALFFFSDIAENDSFELRRAIRNHKIDTIVLSSNGGSIWEALTMSGIIFDKGMTTYIPQIANQGCFSACAFMFFAGHNRSADGKLGVHQMGSYSESGDKKKTEIGKAEQTTQFAVSEIIGFLNEFNTPPFVLERMFRSRDMYIFDEDEMLEIEIGTVDNDLVQAINTFNEDLIDYLEVAIQQSVEPPSFVEDRDSVRALQVELNRVGCRAGTVDGIWGRQTAAAAKRFARHAKLVFNGPDSINQSFLKKLKSANIGHCPAPLRKPSPAQISSRWNFKITCSGKKISGSATIYGKRKVAQSTIYSVAYSNSLGGSYTGYIKVVKRDFNIYLAGGRSSISGNGSFSTSYNRAVGTTSDGCAFQGVSK